MQGPAHSFVVCDKCLGRHEQVSAVLASAVMLALPSFPTPSHTPALSVRRSQVGLPLDCTRGLVNHAHPGFSRQDDSTTFSGEHFCTWGICALAEAVGEECRVHGVAQAGTLRRRRGPPVTAEVRPPRRLPSNLVQGKEGERELRGLWACEVWASPLSQYQETARQGAGSRST